MAFKMNFRGFGHGTGSPMKKNGKNKTVRTTKKGEKKPPPSHVYEGEYGPKTEEQTRWEARGGQNFPRPSDDKKTSGTKKPSDDDKPTMISSDKEPDTMVTSTKVDKGKEEEKVPAPGTAARKAYYDEKGWKYDETIPGFTKEGDKDVIHKRETYEYTPQSKKK
tara:strand:+ start:266 stop:757 length:492 start_codon:yes stop_codon:yes gene_type:complete